VREAVGVDGRELGEPGGEQSRALMVTSRAESWCFGPWWLLCANRAPMLRRVEVVLRRCSGRRNEKGGDGR
jgi:hypothetical protein